MCHDATKLHIRIPLIIDIPRQPIINDALVALVDVVRAGVVIRDFERVLVA